MYVIGTDQCSMPNSASPISQQCIDAETALLTSVQNSFDNGDGALNSLITALGGNPGGDTTVGASGVPTTGTLVTSNPGIPVVGNCGAPSQALLPDVNNPSFWAWGDSPVPSQVTPGNTAAPGACSSMYGNSAPQVDQNPPAGCPVIVPLVTEIPIPQMAPAAISAPAPAPAPAAPAAPVPDCRTGNICLDIMSGCVLSSQVDPAQLQACSAAGYAGNRNLYPAVAAKGGAGGGAYLGFPDPSPTPYVPGMSGLGQISAQDSNASLFSNVFEYAVSGLAAGVAIGILMKRKRS